VKGREHKFQILKYFNLPLQISLSKQWSYIGFGGIAIHGGLRDEIFANMTSRGIF